MYLTIVLIVIFAAVVVFFSEEIAGVIIKIFSIPGVKLLLPLTFASWVVEYYQEWGLWILLWCKKLLHQLVHQLAANLPFHVGSVFFVHVTHLFLLGCLPIWIGYGVAKYRGMYEPWPYAFLSGMLLWLVAAILLTVHRP